MKSLLKSFFITFIVAMGAGILLLLFMNVSYDNKVKNEIAVQNKIDKKIKRNATECDILDILQIINLNNKKVITEILINPLYKNIEVNPFNSNFKFASDEKTLGELYDYGGVKYLINKVNKKFNKHIDKYIIINGEDKLIDLLDVVGSIDINGKLYSEFSKNLGIKYSIIDSECFVSLIKDQNDDKILSELIRQYFVQKISVIDTEMGEKIFKEIVNNVDSNISYKDYHNLIELDLTKFQ